MHNGAQTYAHAVNWDPTLLQMTRCSQRRCDECGLVSGPMSLTHGSPVEDGICGCGVRARQEDGLISSPHSTQPLTLRRDAGAEGCQVRPYM